MQIKHILYAKHLRRIVGRFPDGLLGSLFFASTLLWMPAVHAAPTGGQVTAGSGAISQTGSNTTINQASQNLSLNWQSFNIGAHESVNFMQPNASAIAVNRIADTSASQILGSLNSNGQVFLINPNGIVFGAGAQVNVGGLVASTLGMSDSDLSAATRHFSGSGTGAVINHGTIAAAPGGYVALLGREVSNQGTIRTPGGTAALGAGSAVSLSFDANHLLSMQVDQSTLSTLAENKQLIVADGGQVLMSAGARNSLLASVVNNTGVVQAQTVANHNGRIMLLAGMAAGTTEVSGTLDASAPNGGDGGFIETSSAHVRVSDAAHITTKAAAGGQTGAWLIDPQDYTIAASGGDITGSTLSSNLGSSSITILSNSGGAAGSGNINVNDAVNWSANTLTLTAANNINVNAVMTASGSAGLVLNTATANGTDAGVTGGAVNAMPGVGRVDFAGRSGTGFLTINGHGYTVLNNIGAEGDATSGAATLQGMAASANLAGHYALGADIDASATSGWNSGAGFDLIGNSSTSFTGSFDGLGHTISGVMINRPATDNVGLFGTTVNPEIRNVGLTSINVAGKNLVGGLVGYKYGGSVSNSYATGHVVGGLYAGGLVGANMGSISTSYAAVTVSGNFGTGGLVGYNRGSVNDSYATGQVTGSDWYTGGLLGGNTGSGSVNNSYATGNVIGHNSAAGGLVGGSVDTSSISNSYATGNVSSEVNDVGGLVGSSYATISNSYATGQVSGNAVNVGGLVGIQYSGSISQSYATGAVSGPNAGGSIGGLVGGRTGGTVSSSYWDTQTTGQNHSTGSADTFGLTSAEMLNAANFTSWDIATTGGSTSTWRIYEGHTTPLLRAFMTNLAVPTNIVSTYTGATFTSTDAYASGTLTPSFWHPSTSVDTSLLVGSINTVTPATDAGVYQLTGAPYSGQMGYDMAFTAGTLTINPAPLQYVANNATRPYGAADPAFTGTVTGFVGSDTLASVTTGTLAWTTPAYATSPGGLYPIFGNGLSVTNPNYSGPGQATGNLTALTVQAEILPPVLPTPTVPNEVRMAIGGLTQGLVQSDSEPSNTGHTSFDVSGQSGSDDSKLFTVVGSGVRLP